MKNRKSDTQGFEDRTLTLCLVQELGLIGFVRGSKFLELVPCQCQLALEVLFPVATGSAVPLTSRVLTHTELHSSSFSRHK